MKRLLSYAAAALALISSAFTVALVAVPAVAAPGIKTEVSGSATPAQELSAAQKAVLQNATPEQQTALKALLQKLQSIDDETEIAAENYNQSRARLARIRSSIAKTKSQYAVVNRAHKLQVERLNERAVSIYRNGNESLLSILFDSKSFKDLITRMQYLADISSADARLLGQINDQQKELKTTLEKLEADEKEASSLEFELKARKIEVARRNADRAEALKKENTQLLALLSATQANEAAQEQTLANQIVDGRLEDVTIQSGSPVETAMAYRGIKYVWGGASKSGFDCSGLLVYVFKQHGVSLPHYSGSQYRMGERVTGELLPGDAVFFGSPVHHVGIYVGGGYFIHAPHTGDVVKISKLSTMSGYVGARRYNWQTRTEPIK